MSKAKAPKGWEDMDPSSDTQWWTRYEYPYRMFVEERPQPDGVTLWDFQVHHINARPGSYEHQGYRTTRASAVKTCERYLRQHHERAQQMGLL